MAKIYSAGDGHYLYLQTQFGGQEMKRVYSYNPEACRGQSYIGAYGCCNTTKIIYDTNNIH